MQATIEVDLDCNLILRGSADGSSGLLDAKVCGERKRTMNGPRGRPYILEALASHGTRGRLFQRLPCLPYNVAKRYTILAGQTNLADRQTRRETRDYFGNHPIRNFLLQITSY